MVVAQSKDSYLEDKIRLNWQGLELVIKGLHELLGNITAFVSTPCPSRCCLILTPPILLPTAYGQATITTETFFVDLILSQARTTTIIRPRVVIKHQVPYNQQLYSQCAGQ